MNCFLENSSSYLKELVKYLKLKQIELSKKMTDGRINSAINENEVLKILSELNSKEKDYYILEGISRDWADLYLISKESKKEYEKLKEIYFLYEKSKKLALKKEWLKILESLNNQKHLIPINIKITTTKTNDNINAKEGIYFSLTGKVYIDSNDWYHFLTSLKSNLAQKEPATDYYFLIVNKEDTQDIFFNSLRMIKYFVPNGNNPPFQVKWTDNKIPDKVSFEVAKKRILGALGVTLYQRANPWLIFQENFPDYIKV